MLHNKGMATGKLVCFSTKQQLLIIGQNQYHLSLYTYHLISNEISKQDKVSHIVVTELLYY